MPLDGACAIVDEDHEEDLEATASISSTINLSPTERILAVEIQIAQLRRDAAIIRRSGHTVLNEMQKFVVLEQQCVNNLTSINTQLAGVVAKVENLNISKARAEGSLYTIIKVASIIMGLALVYGALSGKIHFNF